MDTESEARKSGHSLHICEHSPLWKEGVQTLRSTCSNCRWKPLLERNKEEAVWLPVRPDPRMGIKRVCGISSQETLKSLWELPMRLQNPWS